MRLIFWMICLFGLPTFLWSQEVQLSDFQFMEGKWAGEFEYFQGEGAKAFVQVPMTFEFKLKKDKAKYSYTYFVDNKTKRQKGKLLVRENNVVVFEKNTFILIKSKQNDIMIQRKNDFYNYPTYVVRQFILKNNQLLITSVITKDNDSFLKYKYTLQK